MNDYQLGNIAAKLSNKITKKQALELLSQLRQEKLWYEQELTQLTQKNYELNHEIYTQQFNFANFLTHFLQYFEKTVQSQVFIESQNQVLLNQQNELVFKNKELNNLIEELKTNQDEMNMQREYLQAIVIEMEGKQAEIEMQRDYLTAMVQELENTQKEVLEKNKLLEKTSHILNDTYTNIKASINYAKRIQDAMLPGMSILVENFKEYFVLFEPKDTVSGDFYWFAKLRNKIIIAAVDCTGHGVPGAFMSMLGMELLHHIVNVQHIDDADQILNQLHYNVRRMLKQESNENRDGMDIALVVIDKKNRLIEFAGAHNPLIFFQNNTLSIIKADRQPIGGFQREPVVEFTKKVISIQEDTTFYIFSDGYQDLCNGRTGRRFMSSNMRVLLKSIQDKPLNKQKKILRRVMDFWIKSKNHQLDDVLVIGVHI